MALTSQDNAPNDPVYQSLGKKHILFQLELTNSTDYALNSDQANLYWILKTMTAHERTYYRTKFIITESDISHDKCNRQSSIRWSKYHGLCTAITVPNILFVILTIVFKVSGGKISLNIHQSNQLLWLAYGYKLNISGGRIRIIILPTWLFEYHLNTLLSLSENVSRPKI